ncbi:hypothetical protein GK091_11175 [Spirosoma agri]|uniref:O-antigen ligase family protein n=1 Tax=Spirosoma agri TaxID=1987381 RepID=A0A6M0IGZ2_9BACT|nr:hypothetical protein [Spirosoma agri]
MSRQKPKSVWLLRGVWAYFILLIFEGALRKWVLPEIASPLLVIRDPIALWLVLRLILQKKFPFTSFTIGSIAVGIIGTITAIIIGHGNLTVALFGARIFLIHIPALYAIGIILNKNDVENMGKVLLWLTAPMVMLVIFQFYSPQSAWVNRGVGGDLAGAGFGNVLGYSRPPGVFSFANGNTLFFSLVCCFVFYFWFNTKSVNKLALITATVGLVVAIPLSISRTLLFQVVITGIFSLFIGFRKPRFITHLIIGTLVFGLLLFILNSTNLFKLSTEVFVTRFTDANESEGGLEGVFIDRFLGGMYNALVNSTDLPFFGYGLGLGSNVGSQLLTGQRTFLVAEQEWGRIIGELGALLGIFVIFLRVLFAFKLAILSYKKLQKDDVLPWLILSLGFLLIAQGQWAQPTSLGFSVFVGGLLLASLKKKANN